MALVDLSTKQSLLGLSSPISDMSTTTGTQFADFRNASFGVGPEPNQDPDLPLLDALAEKSLTQPHTYGYGSPYTTTMFGGNVTIPAVGGAFQDLDGLRPSPTYSTGGGPADGYY